MSKKNSKKTRIVNPRTGSTVFAILPAIGNPESPHFVSSGNIYLLEGDNWGPARDFKGYGLAHIIGKHGPELDKAKQNFELVHAKCELRKQINVLGRLLLLEFFLFGVRITGKRIQC